jgi:hypothetical protein
MNEKEDEYHFEVLTWMDKNEMPPGISLDELLYIHNSIEAFMTETQVKEANVLMEKFNEL